MLLLMACKKTETVVSYDVTDATVRSFALAANDSFPGLAAATFTVENRTDTGMIAVANGDSMRYGTRLNAVVPRVQFNSRPAAALYHVGDTVFTYSGYDTLDLTQSPVYLHVFAADRTHEKYYRIVAYAHQADPDQYTITPLNAQFVAPCAMQVCYTGHYFHAFLSDGSTLRMTRSTDAALWETAQTITGLPASCSVRQIVYDSLSGSFCYATGTQLYQSTDGVMWTAQTLPLTGSEVLSTLIAFDKHVWLLLRQGEHMVLATWNPTDNEVQTVDSVPSSFPVSDFAPVHYLSSGGRQHALLYGGYDQRGTMLSDAWSVEALSDGMYRVMNVSQRNAQPMAGAAIVHYNGQLLRIGGLTETGDIASVAYSVSEGMFWQAADTAHLPVPDGFLPRYRISADVVDNNIYLFGGQNHTQQFADCYRSRLNSIDW